MKHTYYVDGVLFTIDVYNTCFQQMQILNKEFYNTVMHNMVVHTQVFSLIFPD